MIEINGSENKNQYKISAKGHVTDVDRFYLYLSMCECVSFIF